MTRALISILSVAAPLPIANIDTDQILPKQFLTTLARTGLGRGLLYDMRFDEAGAERPEFVLNHARYKDAAILIAGPNFGCGSSREHAAWALKDFGIRCLIAPSFGEIFRNNCVNNGILPVALGEGDVDQLFAEAEGGGVFDIDVAAQMVTAPSGRAFRFDLETGAKRRLLEGLDDIELTLRRLAEIEAFEQRRAQTLNGR
jgi:3-isopropylmalate/(R)-2-methylmalate dehydratase small subunit